MCPPTVLLRIEFTAADCSQPSGELLPRLSTLASSQAPYPSLCRKRQSSVTSLLLLFAPKQASMRVRGMGRFAVYLCCTFPEVAFGGRYPLSLPCGARTFLMNRLSPCPRDCPSYSQAYYTQSSVKSQITSSIFPCFNRFIFQRPPFTYKERLCYNASIHRSQTFRPCDKAGICLWAFWGYR